MKADFTTHQVPDLAVPCEHCGRPVGEPCVRASGELVPKGRVHELRGKEADRVFLEQHGPFARIYRRKDRSLYIAIKEPVEA